MFRVELAPALGSALSHSVDTNNSGSAFVLPSGLFGAVAVRAINDCGVSAASPQGSIPR